LALRQEKKSSAEGVESVRRALTGGYVGLAPIFCSKNRAKPGKTGQNDYEFSGRYSAVKTPLD
jgi:hypothetical protein